MKAALLNGTVGLVLSLVLGVGYLNLSTRDILLSILVSNLAALVSLVLTLQAEGIAWILKHVLNRSLKTWTLLVSLYMGILIALSPCLRAIEPFKYLIFPLILSSGYAIILFGPIQDYLVRRKQRLANAKNDFPCFPTDSAVL